ncbi:MAG: preprotein translocase subunit SecG [Sphingorhabdus sp.]
MGLFDFLIVVQGIIAAALVGIILMQRSEGGGLGMGGSPSGLMSARGAADFMTRTTTILAVLFVLLSISLAFVAAQQGTTGTLDESLDRTKTPITAPVVPAAGEAATPAAEGAPTPEAPTGGEIPVE